MGKLLVVPFFIQHEGCPFTCAFCNQWKITGAQGSKPEDVAVNVLEYIKASKRQLSGVEVAFFGGSFTGLAKWQQVKWLEQAAALRKEGYITGIRLSTRPDYITDDILRLLQDYGVTTIELGVQSLVDEVLTKSRRGHLSRDVFKATQLIRRYPFSLVYQLMLGLPGDNEHSALLTARGTVAAKPDGVRIYPAVVLKDTLLAQWYLSGEYQPWSLEAAVSTAAKWFAIFSLYQIPVIRMGLQAVDSLLEENELVAGPYHPAFGELVESRLMLEQTLDLLKKAQERQGGQKQVGAALYFNPADCSKVVGHKRNNILTIKKLKPGLRLELRADEAVASNDLALKTPDSWIKLTRQEFLKKYRINL